MPQDPRQELPKLPYLPSGNALSSRDRPDAPATDGEAKLKSTGRSGATEGPGDYRCPDGRVQEDQPIDVLVKLEG